VVEEVSGLADIPTDASLYDSGLDSLSAIQLRNVLAEKFPDVEFAATLVFDHTSIDKISAYILQQLALTAPGISPNAGPRNSPGNQPLEPGSNRAKPNGSGSRGVAVIGVEARMPGSSNSFESFFANLCAGVDGIRDVPYARWDADDFFDPNPTAGGKACYVQRAGFVDDIEYFDNETFGITPMEAKVMDPSQRVMLETAYRAFAAAGYEPSRLKDTNTGVFVGSLSPDWRQVLTAGELTAYSGTGSALSIMANRISYFFGLLGPSMTVDTACSSSLVAMDLALQNIASGRCTMALVGGVQSILTNSPFINGCRARMLSPKGHCHTWDAGADGYAKAEGCGALVLKELAAAERDGDNILAVVRGSAVNQDGRSANMTTPYGPSQQAVIRQALQNAGVTPDEVCYIETHGTGTPLGDPIEVEALRQVFSTDTRAVSHRPLYLGAVKSSIGHLEGAAGIAGLLKAVATLVNRKCKSSWVKHTFDAAVSRSGSTDSSGQLVCGVSGFGFGGTNAHVVLSSYEPEVSLAGIMTEQNREKKRMLPTGTEQPILDKVAFLFPGQGCHYLEMGKSLFAEDELFAAAVMRCEDIWMDQGLLDGLSLTRDILWPTEAQDPPLLEDTRYTQPASKLIPFRSHSPSPVFLDTRGRTSVRSKDILFAIQYGLYESLARRGIRPAAVMGHSFGEFAAAVAAGIMRLEDAAKLVALRASIAASLTLTGVMYLIHAPRDTVQKAIDSFTSGLGRDKRAANGVPVAIAASNGPRMTNIAGTEEACAAVCSSIKAPKVKLDIPHAYHSPLMQSLLEGMRAPLSQVSLCSPSSTSSPRSTRFFPTISGYVGSDSHDDSINAQYWLDQCVRDVDFMPAIRLLADSGYDTFVEIGPRPTLTKMGQRCVTDAQKRQSDWLATLCDD
ncbi:thiolase-like protein, partial [Diaporthe sp. PMI_573]